MIVPKGPNLWRMLVYVGLPLVLLIGWDILIVVAYNGLHWQWVGSKNIPLALYGSIIGIIVGFRNNSAYARWWEARGLWGQIVNSSRSLARQVCTTLRTEDAESELAALQKRIVYHQIAFVRALRQQLRDQDPLAGLQSLLDAHQLGALKGEVNVPLAIQKEIGRMLGNARDQGWTDPFEWLAMDRNLDGLTDAQGGVERIKSTPMPKQYEYFPMLFVQIYCLLLPSGMVEQLGWFTPLGSTVVGFMLLALDRIGRDLEDPFDNTIHDIPMTAITTTIEINLRQMLGEKDLPAPVKPVRGVLW